MLGDPSYKKRWDSKKKLYEGHGIIEGKNLVVSCDGLNGSIDCIEIEKKIEMIKGWLK